MKIERIAEIVRGVFLKRVTSGVASGVTIDSRKAAKGNLFVAIRGEKNDGHAFVQRALKTCAAALVEKRIRTKTARPVILVHDTKTALQELAAYWRTRISPAVVAVTGSNGKTTTKDMLAHILAKKLRTVAAEKSYNNFLGVPLTVLKADEKTQALVTEMETNVLGGIRRLCLIAQPRVGIITNIGGTHLSYLGNVENVFREKSELASCLSDGGTAVVNADDKYAVKLRKTARAGTITFSLAKKSDFRAEIIKSDLDGSRFKINGVKFNLKIPGKFNAANAAAATAAAYALGIPLKVSSERLSSFSLRTGRTGILRKGGSILINDSFNANPDSVKALCTILRGIPGKKILVFADMLELGKDAARLHSAAGRLFAAAGVKKIFYTGSFGKQFIAGARKTGKKIDAAIYGDRKKLTADVLRELPCTAVFKGSRKMNVDGIYAYVAEHISSRSG